MVLVVSENLGQKTNTGPVVDSKACMKREEPGSRKQPRADLTLGLGMQLSELSTHLDLVSIPNNTN